MSNNESWGEEHLRPLWEEEREKRMEAVFQNGNDGTHYSPELARYENQKRVENELASIKRMRAAHKCIVDMVVGCQGVGWRDHFARCGGKLANTDEKC